MDYFITSIFGTAKHKSGKNCSCAGNPLIRSQNISSVSKGTLLLGVTYQYNDISNLYTGSDILTNQSVYRNTQSTLTQNGLKLNADMQPGAGAWNGVIWSYIAMINYRSTASDRRNDQTLPNTGSKWINLEPAIQYQITQGVSAKASGKIPVFQHLNHIQPTTAYIVSLSVFYNLGNQVIFKMK